MRMSLLIPGIIIIVVAVAGIMFFGLQGRSALRKARIVVAGKTIQVEVAETALSRAQGLSGRDGLDSDSGMLFIFTSPGKNGFWMKDMKFPIDMVWIAGNRVLGVTENAAPEPEKSMFRLTVHYPPGPVDKVLELPAGAAKTYGIASGTLLSIED